MDSIKNYWNNRYQTNGNSGAGSYGLLAQYKAGVINDFIAKNKINSVGDFGFGDGNQLSKLVCPKYTGFDISEAALEICVRKFAADKTKRFLLANKFKAQKFDLSLSLDVIFHLTDDTEFNTYMTNLFRSSRRYVIIYSSNGNALTKSAPHIKDRNFTAWIEANQPDFRTVRIIANPYKYNEKAADSKNTSISDFYIYQKV